ncbi:hypothetical protein Tco_1223947, partial [Tanacetum coccineum]
PNGDALRKCILEGPYTPSTVTILAVPVTDDTPAVPERTATAHEIWIAIERLQQGESLNIQDVKTNLFWEFRKFTSHDGETMESYYSRMVKPRMLTHQAPKSHKPYAATSKQSSCTKSNASTKFKGKEIAKPITPPSKSASEEDSDPEQAQRDKDMQKNLALIAKYFKKIYKPTNNNLRTFLNSKNKNVDTSQRYKNDTQTG